VISDVAPQAIERTRAAYPGVEVLADADTLIRSDIDVFAPCALGGALNDETVVALRAKIVCGAANNQLAHPGIDKLLDDRGILFAPDYLVNAGGVIQVSDELHGFDFARAKRKTTAIFDTAKAVFALAKGEAVSPEPAAVVAPDEEALRGLVSGYGMVAYGRGVSSSAAILERAD